jgi:hypothetical protein
MDPDLYFRGFYCWNSKVGSKTLDIASFYLRAVCMNRNLWGVENFEEITIPHSRLPRSVLLTRPHPHSQGSPLCRQRRSSPVSNGSSPAVHGITAFARGKAHQDARLET